MSQGLTSKDARNWTRHITKIFGRNNDIASALHFDYLKDPEGFASGTAGREGRVLVGEDGVVKGVMTPQLSKGLSSSESMTNFLVSSMELDQFIDYCGIEKLSPWGAADMVLRIPNTMLFSDIDPRYHLYRISFIPENGDRYEPSMAAVWNGYFGITSRSPLDRFAEHRRSAIKGTGHLLHRVWNGLIRAQPKTTVVMTIIGYSKSLKGVYKLEEDAVYAHTLNPKGLNAIPGGQAGLKVLHQLALLKNNKMVDVEVRDRALVLLDSGINLSKCTHYRRGHIRKLPSGKLTWVSPCWINKSENDLTGMAA